MERGDSLFRWNFPSMRGDEMKYLNIPKQPKISRGEARRLVKISIAECKKLHKAIKDGSWKPSYEVNIIGGKR